MRLTVLGDGWRDRSTDAARSNALVWLIHADRVAMTDCGRLLENCAPTPLSSRMRIPIMSAVSGAALPARSWQRRKLGAVLSKDRQPRLKTSDGSMRTETCVYAQGS
jgi:hypothetical protein